MEFNVFASNKDWEKLSLDKLCLKITSGGTPSRKNQNLYENGNINWVKTKELNNGYIFETEEKITEEAIKKSSAKLLPINTILLAMYGATVGELGILGKEMACNQACCALIVDPEKADYRFIFYLLRLYKKEIQSLATGAAQQNLSAKAIKEFNFYIPSLKKQKEISDILSELDRKIELNTQINQTLEQIAQAIFKSWFVDFDPVRAKAAALESGKTQAEAELAAQQAISGKTAEELAQMPSESYAELAEIAKAFPSEFGEDGVPMGWEYQYLKDVCNIVYGKNLPTAKLMESGYPVFGGNGVIGCYDKFLYKTPQTLVSCRGAASGKVLYSLPNSFITNNSLVIENEKSGLSYFYVYESLRLQNLTELTSGSAQPQMTIANMASVQILVPSSEITGLYNKYVEVFYNKKFQSDLENRELSKLRDLLLPKLLNGEITNA